MNDEFGHGILFGVHPHRLSYFVIFDERQKKLKNNLNKFLKSVFYKFKKTFIKSDKFKYKVYIQNILVANGQIYSRLNITQNMLTCIGIKPHENNFKLREKSSLELKKQYNSYKCKLNKPKTNCACVGHFSPTTYVKQKSFFKN